jgi:hypothetical protein
VTRPIYRALLRLYPWDYATAFSTDMTTAFDEACQEQWRRGRRPFIRFAITEFVGLMLGAGNEWLAKLTAEESVRGRYLPDLRMMRPAGVSQELWFASAKRERRAESTIVGEQASSQVR